jgi:hypothetical protein
MSRGESSHVKERESNPLVTAGIASRRLHSGYHVLPVERRAPQMRDGDIDMFTPTVEPTQVSTP